MRSFRGTFFLFSPSHLTNESIVREIIVNMLNRVGEGKVGAMIALAEFVR